MVEGGGRGHGCWECEEAWRQVLIRYQKKQKRSWFEVAGAAASPTPPLTAPFLLRFTSVPGGTGISMGGVTAFLMPWFFLGPLLPTAGLALLPRGAAYSLRLCRCSRES